MPRSTTAWLMASFSVAFSAVSPIQINSRLMALNIIVLSSWCSPLQARHRQLRCWFPATVQWHLAGGHQHVNHASTAHRSDDGALSFSDCPVGTKLGRKGERLSLDRKPHIIAQLRVGEQTASVARMFHRPKEIILH